MTRVSSMQQRQASKEAVHSTATLLVQQPLAAAATHLLHRQPDATPL